MTDHTNILRAHPEDIEIVTQPRLETGDDVDPAGNVVENPYTWLNDVVLVGQGRLGPSFPGYITARWLETRAYVVENC